MGSRPWPFSVTWRHWSRDYSISHRPFLFGKTPRLATIHYRRDNRRTQYYSISATVSAGRLKTRPVDDEGVVTLCLLVIASRQTTPRWSTRPVSSTAANESGTSSTTALRPHTSSPRPRLWWYLSAERKIRGSCGGMNTLYCDSKCISLMPATRAQETVTRNWYKSSCTRNLHVCRSVWYKFFSGTSLLHGRKKEVWPQYSPQIDATARNRTQLLYSNTGQFLCWNKAATCLTGQLFWCKKLWWTCVKFFVQVSGASFVCVCRRHNCSDEVVWPDFYHIW